MFTISLCMIVKNEEKVLARLLDCVKQFADEIIIVDTGSTDRTKDIAKKYTDKIYDFKWCDDFSKARNFSFSKATCDYQMWLDADDFVTHKNIQKILELKQSKETETDVYMFKYSTGFDANNTPFLTYFRERLLKRTDCFKWAGFVHEAIAPFGKIEYLDIEIEHRKSTDNKDGKRNLNLYRKAIKRGEKFNAREMYYYSRELYYNNYIPSAIKNLKKFLKIKNSYPPDNYGAYVLLSDCFLLKNQIDLSLNTLFVCLQNHTPTAELCCKIGHLYDIKKEKERAIFWYKSALSCPKQTTGFVKETYSNITPFLELTKLLYSINFQESKMYHQKAKAVCPNHPSVLFNEKFFKD